MYKRVLRTGPEFQIESDNAFLVLGHSERNKVGEFWAETMVDRGLFDDVEVVPLNKASGFTTRTAIRDEMKNRTVVTHSAGVMHVPAARQIIAFNPPEKTTLPQLAKGAVDILSDPIIAEDGSHKTDLLDMLGAGFELIRSPWTTVSTPLNISRGYSTGRELAAGRQHFPAGRAIVHSEHDGFGFSDIAKSNIELISRNGVTFVWLPDHHHNEVLFTPNRTLDLVEPILFNDN